MGDMERVLCHTDPLGKVTCNQKFYRGKGAKDADIGERKWELQCECPEIEENLAEDGQTRGERKSRTPSGTSCVSDKRNGIYSK